MATLKILGRTCNVRIGRKEEMEEFEPVHH
jgi:hypothetical protein